MENRKQTTFAAVVTGNSLRRAKTGSPCVFIRVRTAYDIEKPEEKWEMTVVGNLWLTYKCVKQTVITLQEAFDWKGHAITDFNEPILVGKKCEIVCEIEEWEGEERWRIAFFNRPGGMKGMETGEMDKLVSEVQPMINEVMGGEERRFKRQEGEVIGPERNTDNAAINMEASVEDEMSF